MYVMKELLNSLISEDNESGSWRVRTVKDDKWLGKSKWTRMDLRSIQVSLLILRELDHRGHERCEASAYLTSLYIFILLYDFVAALGDALIRRRTFHSCIALICNSDFVYLLDGERFYAVLLSRAYMFC